MNVTQWTMSQHQIILSMYEVISQELSAIHRWQKEPVFKWETTYTANWQVSSTHGNHLHSQTAAYAISPRGLVTQPVSSMCHIITQRTSYTASQQHPWDQLQIQSAPGVIAAPKLAFPCSSWGFKYGIWTVGSITL
jgi:hypothetical protein